MLFFPAFSPLALLLAAGVQSPAPTPVDVESSASTRARAGWVDLATRGHLRLERGHAHLQDGAGLGREVRAGESAVTGPRGHLDLGGVSSARLSWFGACSAHLTGPSSLEWSREPDCSRLQLFELSSAEFESRRGTQLIVFPGGWRATLVEASLASRQLPDGGLELTVRAGKSVMVDWVGDPQHPRPPVWLHAGAPHRFRSVPEAYRGPVPTTAWESSSWPWSAASETPEQRGARLALEQAQRRQLESETFWPEAAGPSLPPRKLPQGSTSSWSTPERALPSNAWPARVEPPMSSWPVEELLIAEPGRSLAPWDLQPLPAPGQGESSGPRSAPGSGSR